MVTPETRVSNRARVARVALDLSMRSAANTATTSTSAFSATQMLPSSTRLDQGEGDGGEEQGQEGHGLDEFRYWRDVRGEPSGQNQRSLMHLPSLGRSCHLSKPSK